jgi:hypothetical protein
VLVKNTSPPNSKPYYTMQNFSIHITIDASFKPEFFFNRIYTVAGVRYHVSVIDTERKSWFFNMQARNGKWQIINAPKVPDWIINVEMQLEEAIYSDMINN